MEIYFSKTVLNSNNDLVVDGGYPESSREVSLFGICYLLVTSVGSSLWHYLASAVCLATNTEVSEPEKSFVICVVFPTRFNGTLPLFILQVVKT